MGWDNVSPWVIQGTYEIEDYGYNIFFSGNLTYAP